MTGLARAGWALIGVLVYLIARGGLMKEREFRGMAPGRSYAHNAKVSSPATAGSTILRGPDLRGFRMP